MKKRADGTRKNDVVMYKNTFRHFIIFFVFYLVFVEQKMFCPMQYLIQYMYIYLITSHLDPRKQRGHFINCRTTEVIRNLDK